MFSYFSSNSRRLSSEVQNPYQQPASTPYMQPNMGSPQQPPNIFTPDYSQGYGQIAPPAPVQPSMVPPPPPMSGKKMKIFSK